MAVNKIPVQNPFLVGALVLCAFIIGSLSTRVQTLEKGTATTGLPTTAGAPTPAAPAGKIKEVTDADHIRGNKNAKVTLVEYSDFECPFCKTFHPTMKQVLETYGDDVRWVYRHYPLSFHNPGAQKQAEASECVAELGGDEKFWEFTDKIFERTTSNGTGFPVANLGPLAAEVGVNQAQFQSCLDSGKYTKLVEDQFADGTTGGVSGTPSTFVIDDSGNSKIIVGAVPIDQLKPAIDEALK